MSTTTQIALEDKELEKIDSVDGKLLAEAAPTPPIRGHGSPMALTLSGCTGMTDSENPFG